MSAKRKTEQLPERFEPESDDIEGVGYDIDDGLDLGDEDDEDLVELAEKIFDSIEDDLKDRQGIGDAWSDCDDEIQDEIRESNVRKIVAVLAQELEDY